MRRHFSRDARFDRVLFHDALDGAGLIGSQDAGWLRDAYLLLNRVRNHMFLLRGLATDALPTRDVDIEKLARSLGYGRLSRSRFLERYRRITRRARRVTDRLFYGASAVGDFSLIWQIAAINAWNRVAVATRTPFGEQPAEEG